MCGICMARFSDEAGAETTSGLFRGGMAAEVFEGDDFGDSIGTAAAITIDDDVYGTIDSGSDADYFELQVTAGTTYVIDLFGTGAATELPDTYLYIYDAAGKELARNDDFGGLDSRIIWSADYDGALYIRADAYDTNTGDYALTVDEQGPPSPLDSLDWNYSAASAMNVYLPTLSHSIVEVVGGDGTSFGSTGQSPAWNALARQAFEVIEDAVDITFNFVSSVANADFAVLVGDNGNGFAYQAIGGGTLRVDGTDHRLDSWTYLSGDSADRQFSEAGMARGGDGFATLLHEIGHGLGMAHTHDDSGGSQIMEGVTSAFDSYGAFDLNQNINTVMSYNRGWSGPDSWSPGFYSHYHGGAASLMALDIAYLQGVYGANDSHRGGNSTYVLDGSDGSAGGGTWYESIWDTGGTDTIRVADGETVGATIDLRAATLDYSATGGGVVSHHDGVHGGFTIAAGVLIENARGGNGADTIVGNAADNHLQGRKGRDVIDGGDGADTILGGNGRDLIEGGSGDDVIEGNSSGDRLFGNRGRDWIEGGKGKDRIDGGRDDDILFGGAHDDRINGRADDDRIDGGTGDDLLTGGAGADDFVFSGDWGADTITDWQDGTDGLVFAADSGVTSRFDLVISTNGSGDAVVELASDASTRILIEGAAGQIDVTDFAYIA